MAAGGGRAARCRLVGRLSGRGSKDASDRALWEKKGGQPAGDGMLTKLSKGPDHHRIHRTASQRGLRSISVRVRSSKDGAEGVSVG